MVCMNGITSVPKLKIKISTSVWGAQHLNAGRNIQHLSLPLIFYLTPTITTLLLDQKIMNYGQ